MHFFLSLTGEMYFATDAHPMRNFRPMLVWNVVAGNLGHQRVVQAYPFLASHMFVDRSLRWKGT